MQFCGVFCGLLVCFFLDSVWFDAGMARLKLTTREISSEDQEDSTAERVELAPGSGGATLCHRGLPTPTIFEKINGKLLYLSL